MANTRMSAKNGFLEGLIMDFSPTNSTANSLSSALNATLITYNGNEMSLLNDMGNGRVETAFLPEGYIPVGTCEFGDIIYIVSYNPLTNKSLIGCFPSPERNISTEEIGGLGQTIKWQDFQEGTGKPNGKLKTSSIKKILYDNRDMTPGDKYIIYSLDLLYSNNNKYLSDYGNTSNEHGTFPKLVKIHVVSIEESGKIVYLDSTTKWYDNNYYLLDSGKKNDKNLLDLDDYRDLLSSGYSVFSSKISGKLALLIELEKITGFSCAWEPYTISNTGEGTQNEKTEYSIYFHYNWNTNNNDINPDGVALLASEWKDGTYQEWSLGDKLELGQPKTVSTAIPRASDTSRYDSFTRHYELESNINYSSFLLTNYDYIINNQYLNAYKLNIKRDIDGIPIPSTYYINCNKIKNDVYYSGNTIIYPKTIYDSIVNNYFHYPVIKHFYDFTIPTKLTFTVSGEKIVKFPNINNLIYYYKVAPTMPYGILEEYALEGYIDFSKIGSKHINLNTWKYYNYENTSTLTWGMEAYSEPNKGISEVVFEFYDNNGFVAAYHTKNKLSYNGVFTEYITLNESGTNYKLNNIQAFPEIDNTNNPKPTYHKGIEVTKDTAAQGFMYTKDGNTWIPYSDLEEGETYYMDDSGTLYSNCLYLVKIIIKYCKKNMLEEYIMPTSEQDEGVIIDHRWLWTNNMFNEYYYQVLDFKDLLATLTLDGVVNYKSTDKWNIKNVNYVSNVKGPIEDGKNSLSANVQYINDKDNIEMTVQGGLINDYNTFNLSLNNLSSINCRIHLADLYLNNSPEKPEVIFSDKETIVYEGIYPTLGDFKNYKGLDNMLGTLSKTLNKLIDPNSTKGNDVDIWENYENYYNIFLLDYNGNNLEPGKIHYIRYNGEYTQENDDTPKIDTKYIDTSLDKGIEGFKLSLSGIYFSKYYYQTKKEDKVGRLRPFVLEEQDLDKYNISVTNNNFFFNKALAMSVRNRGGLNTMITGGIVSFSSPSLCNDVEELERMNSKGENSTEGGGDVDIPASLFISRHNKAIVEKFNFLFPIIIAGFLTNTGYKPWVEGTNKNSKISNNKDMSDGKYVGQWSDLDLGGTLAGISTNLEIELGNHYTTTGTKNVLTRFTLYVLRYLTLFYYLDNSVHLIDVPGNYIYLNDNSLNYTRDIVLELNVKNSWNENSNNHSELILFKKYKTLYEYILEVLGNDGRGTSAKNTDPNVNIELKSCLKNCPIICVFDYILPQMLYSTSNFIEIASCFEEVPTVLNNDFVPQHNVVYGWDFNSNTFKNAKEMLLVNNATYKLNSNNNIIGTLGTTYSSVNNYSKNFTIDNLECLLFRNIPGSSSSKTYKVYTCDDNGAPRGISGLKTGLKYY